MGRFRNALNKVVISVDDAKDERYHGSKLWEALGPHADGGQGGDTGPRKEPAMFDPAAHNVAEVNEYLDTADQDERARVLALESEENGGKGRSGIVAGPHADGGQGRGTE